MRLYPQLPARRFATVGHDVLLLVVLVLLAWLGLKVHDAVDQLAVFGSGIKKVGDTVPVVGGPVSDLGQEGEDSVHYLANLLGLVTFGLPALIVLWWLLPQRMEQIRRLTAGSRVLYDVRDPQRRRIVAERAAYSLPYGRLLEYTDDPLGDLAAERYDPLVSAALEDAGLRPR
jgi:hypothetical protein